MLDQDKQKRLDYLESVISDIDDILIVNWIEPGNENGRSYVQALHELVQNEIGIHEYFRIEKERNINADLYMRKADPDEDSILFE